MGEDGGNIPNDYVERIFVVKNIWIWQQIWYRVLSSWKVSIGFYNRFAPKREQIIILENQNYQMDMCITGLWRIGDTWFRKRQVIYRQYMTSCTTCKIYWSLKPYLATTDTFSDEKGSSYLVRS